MEQTINLVENFGVLVEHYRDALYRYCFRMCRNGAMAEDMVQDTFIRAFKYRETFREGEPVKPWLYRIALNVCRTTLSRRPPVVPMMDVDAMGSRCVEHARQMDDTRKGLEEDVTDRMAVKAALDGLSAPLREAVVLYYLEGMSVKELAETLSISESAAKVRLMRGRAALADRLEKTRSSS